MLRTFLQFLFKQETFHQNLVFSLQYQYLVQFLSIPQMLKNLVKLSLIKLQFLFQLEFFRGIFEMEFLKLILYMKILYNVFLYECNLRSKTNLQNTHQDLCHHRTYVLNYSFLIKFFPHETWKQIFKGIQLSFYLFSF